MTLTAGTTTPVPPVAAGYRIEELVGFGGCGEVWRARDVLTGRLVALKRLHHDGPPAERDRLRREAAVLAGLASPHIVRLLTVVTSAHGLILVLEFQGGGSLAALLRTRHQLEPGEVVTIAAPLASALAEVHAAGLVHGDISPANVLFATDGRPVLSDLGVARLAGRAGDEAVTVAYADPAVLEGAPITPPADVYALAAVCFEALTGQPPGDGAGDRPPDEATWPQSRLAAVLASALSPDAALRPDAGLFATQLLEACAPAPVRLTGATVPVAATPTAAVRRLPPPVPKPGPEPSRGELLAVRLRKVRLSPRRLVALAAVPTALAGAIWGGVAWARSSSAGLPGPATWSATATTPVAPPRSPAGHPTTRAVSPTMPAPRTAADVGQPVVAQPVVAQPVDIVSTADMLAVLTRLDQERDSAFLEGRSGLLDQVYAAGSAPLATDKSRLGAMVRAHQRVTGLMLTVRTVELVTVGPSTVRLRVADELSGYDVLAADGRRLAKVPPRALTAWAIRLIRVAPGADGWRIAAISRG
jgi:eukaryotic-like serine/threonine-protein kinase